MRGWLMACVVVCTVTACSRAADSSSPPASICAERMGGDRHACLVTPVHLLLMGEALDGRDVEVILYYPGHGAGLLFAGRDAADANDLTAAILLPEQPADGAAPLRAAQAVAGYYRITGTFQHALSFVPGEGVVPAAVVAGRFSVIRNVVAVRTLSSMLEECLHEACEVRYQSGVTPLPSVPRQDLPPSAK